MKLEKLIASFYIWIIFEGAFRKWVFPSLTNEIHLIKYGFAIFIFIRIAALARQQNKYWKETKLAVDVFAIFCIFSAIYAAAINNPIVGALGLLNYIGFVPLALALPLVIKNKETLYKIFIIAAVLAIGASVLGFIQYLSPYDSFINHYATSDADRNIDTVGNGDNASVRITTLFSYSGSCSVYLLSSCLLIFSMLFEQHKKTVTKVILYTSFAFVIVAMFMNGSRTVVANALVVASIFFLVKRKDVFKNNTNILYMILLIPVALFVLLNYTQLGQKAFGNWSDRFESGGERNEYVSRPVALLNSLDLALLELPNGLYGYGIGAYQNGASQFNKIETLPSEDEAFRVALEVGPIGFLFWYVMIIGVVIYNVYTYRMTTDPFLKNIALIVTIYSCFTVIFERQTVVNWMDSLMWWTCLGLMITIRKIEAEKKKLANEPEKILVVANAPNLAHG